MTKWHQLPDYLRKFQYYNPRDVKEVKKQVLDGTYDYGREEKMFA